MDEEYSYGVTLYNCRWNYVVLPEVMSELSPGMLSTARVEHLILPHSYEKICRTVFSNFRGEFADSVFKVAEGCRRINFQAFAWCKGIKTTRWRN